MHFSIKDKYVLMLKVEYEFTKMYFIVFAVIFISKIVPFLAKIRTTVKQFSL